MSSSTIRYDMDFKHRQSCKNKNFKPNIGLRTARVLAISGKRNSVYMDLLALIRRFDGYSVLLVYTKNVTYVYFKPTNDIINCMLDNRNVLFLDIEDIYSRDLEFSKCIIYPVNKKVLVLEHDTECHEVFESLEKIRKTNRNVPNVNIVNLVRGQVSATTIVQGKNVDVSLKQRLKKTVHFNGYEVDNPLPKPPTLKDIESGKFVYPYTGSGYDFDKLPTQVSEEQRDETRTERVFSNTGSRFWVYPDSNGARFYLEPKITSGSKLLPILTHRRPARYPDYSDYVDRLRTFQTWTAPSPAPERMSQAGFFFTNQSDLIRCFQCGIGLKDFTGGDDPLIEHVRYSGHCPFLPELLDDQTLQKMKEGLQGAGSVYNREAQPAGKKSSATDHDIRHPDFKRPDARLATYSTWSTTRNQTPQQLTEAGLFYSGLQDCVTCFYCGGGLRGWEPNDDPWVEHCRWFPSCGYARQKKGDEFIARAQSTSDHPNEIPSKDEEPKLTALMEGQKFVTSEKCKRHEQNKAACLQMGYTLEIYAEALKDLRNRGIDEPDLPSIIDAIEGLREKRGHSQEDDELYENRRLKSLVYCITCKEEEANILFLPCTHHSYCVACSASFNKCPLCKTNIIEKIRTYMS